MDDFSVDAQATVFHGTTCSLIGHTLADEMILAFPFCESENLVALHSR
ncbi:MAG: hypothetical protein QNK29_05895 [Desulfobacterales bacterium]|nr:hypothetical protein [Desulfobacterales bacterium]